jgi:hypothetical protein
MANKEYKIKVTTEADVQPTIAELKKLRIQLRETSDPEQFKALQQQINDTEDAIKAARVGADNFAEVLGTLPGPIGAIGNQVGGTLQSLKQFGALKFNDLKASFVDLGKDVVDAGKGLLQLTGITKVYEVTTAATSKALQFFGISLNASNTAAKALGATLATLTAATGLIAIVALVDLLSTAWTNYANRAERADEAQKKLNESLLKGSKTALDAESAAVKRSGDLLVAQAKARGANAKEIFNIEQSNRKLLLESQQRYYDDLKNKDSDEAINAIKNIKDTQNSILIADADFKTQQNQAAKQQKEKDDADALQKIQKQEQINKQISDNEKAAAITLLEDRDQERRKIVNDYNTKIKLAEDNGRDTLILEEAKLKALAELNDKYRNEDAAKEREAEFQRLNNLITDLDYENDLLDNDFQEDLQRLANKEAYIAEQKKLELANLDLTNKERLDIIAKYAKQEQDIDKKITDTKKAEMDARTAMQLQYANYVGQVGSIIGQIAGENKDLAIAGIIIEQGAALGKLLIGASSAIAGATFNAKINPANAVPGGGLLVAAKLAKDITQIKITTALSAASIIAGAANGISQINRAKTPGGVGGANASSGGGGATPSFGGAPSMATPQIQSGAGVNPTTQIAETLTNAQGKPIRAYVVSRDVSSQQALDRRTSTAATF